MHVEDMQNFPPPLQGLHHVTAITAHAEANLHFYTGMLGMRLVKKTVNQDDATAYHLFYGDAIASPGTELTFFDWEHIRRNSPGTGVVSETGLRIGGGSAALDDWRKWFESQGVRHGTVETIAGCQTLPFQDDEGQRLRLIADEATTVEVHPWRGSPVPLESAITGLGSVELAVENVPQTAAFLTTILGFRKTENAQFEVGPGGIGARLFLVGGNVSATEGAGGVHHVAWRVADRESLLEWQNHLETKGVRTSGEVDRHYFRSLYFRIPGGVLFEMATDGPGMTADGEELAHLGESLALPPLLEPHRAEISSTIRPLDYQPNNLLRHE